MGTITIELREGRTVEEVYSDAAIVNGYSATIPKEYLTELLTEEEKDNYIFPDGVIEGSKKILNFTQTDQSVLYKIQYIAEESNPESEQVFGEKIVRQVFGEKDSEIAGVAITMRSKIGYGL